MRVVCPNCEAAYEVPESVVQARRKLRCARCSADFLPGVANASPVAAVQVPVVEAAPKPGPAEPAVPSAPSDELASESAAPDRLQRLALAAQFAPPRSAAWLLAASWTASALVLVGLGWAALVWRAPVMHAWPPSTRVYAALGYPT